MSNHIFNQSFRQKSIQFGLTLLICLAVMTTDAIAERLVQRIELYPIQTVTLNSSEFLTDVKKEPSVTIAGELRIPSGIEGRIPAVVLVHGAGGITMNVDPWARDINDLGVAVFIIDCFTGRGFKEGFVPGSKANSLTMIVDAYRALGLLADHPRIDPARIALMGFSRGGGTALYASMKRFQRMYGPKGFEFAAYIPFYPPCWVTYIDDEQVSEKPIRIFHGADDNWVPVEPCRKYVERLQKNGKDAQLTEYPGAHHIFDAPIEFTREFSKATGLGTCELEEKPGGLLVNRATGESIKPTDDCFTKGTTIGGNLKARSEAIEAVRGFLKTTLALENSK
jgi:dienelactone hydrolase